MTESYIGYASSNTVPYEVMELINSQRDTVLSRDSTAFR